MTKTQDKEILKKIGKLLFMCYDGSEPKITSPKKYDLTDIMKGLDALELYIVYQRFDLEASKREIDFLKSLLKDK